MLERSNSIQLDEAAVARWNALLERTSVLPDGVSVMSRYELARLARDVHAADAEDRLLTWSEGGDVAGILPAIVTREPGALRPKRLRLMTDLYPGRPGPLVADYPGPTEPLVRGLLDSEGWDTMELTWVAGSAAEQCFVALAAELKLAVRRQPPIDCPYIRFPDSWDEFLGRLSKKFRYNLRSREKKLRQAGELDMARIERIEQVAPFLAAVRQIENNSWKEAAGTSLTTNPRQWEFHEKMMPACARQDMLRCYLMTLDSEPIAYIIGLVDADTFYCLKSSFVDAHRKFSPGVILKAWAMQELIEEGVGWWDFVGPSAEHKRQWTETSYRLSRYLVFNRGFRGTVLRLRFDLSTRLRGETVTDGDH
ncbi:MAG: GNAT family N-acetyltransferase [Pseudomonadota bacterium]